MALIVSTTFSRVSAFISWCFEKQTASWTSFTHIAYTHWQADLLCRYSFHVRQPVGELNIRMTRDQMTLVASKALLHFVQQCHSVHILGLYSYSEAGRPGDRNSTVVQLCTSTVGRLRADSIN